MNVSRQVWHSKHAVHLHKLGYYSQLRHETDKHRANTREGVKPRQRAQNTATRPFHNHKPETLDFSSTDQSLCQTAVHMIQFSTSVFTAAPIILQCSCNSLKFPTLDQCSVFIIRRLNTLHTNQSTRGYVHKEAREAPGSTRAATRQQQSPHNHPGPAQLSNALE